MLRPPVKGEGGHSGEETQDRIQVDRELRLTLRCSQEAHGQRATARGET